MLEQDKQIKGYDVSKFLGAVDEISTLSPRIKRFADRYGIRNEGRVELRELIRAAIASTRQASEAIHHPLVTDEEVSEMAKKTKVASPGDLESDHLQLENFEELALGGDIMDPNLGYPRLFR